MFLSRKSRLSMAPAFLAALALTLLACGRSSDSDRWKPSLAASAPPADYRLAWSDEFEYEGVPDPARWTSDIGSGRGGWGNNELQYYTFNDNAAVSDGLLTLTLRKERRGRQDYSSARLVSRTKGEWAYGYFEVRARFCSGLGTWPAIWLLSAGDDWPNTGEIDIAEMVGWKPGVVHSVVHTGAYNGMRGTQKQQETFVGDAADGFHVYAAEVTPRHVRFFIDGEPVYTYDPAKHTKEVTAAEFPFGRTPLYLILNIAYGGNFGGAKGLDDAALPATMQIDYVRVWTR